MSRIASLPIVHVLYENPAWLPPLLDGLRAEGFAVRLVMLDEGLIDPDEPPPEGIWLNRISPSSHTRGHHGSVELAREVLFWLEMHGRRVINGLAAFEIEMSKLRQELVLRRYGIRTPRTVLGVGREQVLALARTFEGPFITKHNQGGKGLGIHLFQSADALARYLDSPEYDPGPGAKILLQQYIEAPEPRITRVELVGDRMLFAMHSATTQGFELCPSDACQVSDSVCPADGMNSRFSPAELSADDPLVLSYLSMMQGEGIEVAGIEFIEDADGNRYTYDINGTTNYSGVLGERIGIDGMRVMARYLRRQVVPSLVTASLPHRAAS
ncbi:MAG: alpha-L-glutamate ligase [Myxococcota bacterium]|nr:alpha-L-glutamate ligase [Myxococcota bacterium]